jgi:hypothetical protein
MKRITSAVTPFAFYERSNYRDLVRIGSADSEYFPRGCVSYSSTQLRVGGIYPNLRLGTED